MKILRVFQSHIGAIRIETKLYGQVTQEHFNPTLVQLESRRQGFFQIYKDNFNPTLVQLESANCDATPPK